MKSPLLCSNRQRHKRVAPDFCCGTAQEDDRSIVEVARLRAVSLALPILCMPRSKVEHSEPSVIERGNVICHVILWRNAPSDPMNFRMPLPFAMPTIAAEPAMVGPRDPVEHCC